MIFVTVSTGFFDPLIEKCDALRFQFDFFGQIGGSSYVPHFNHVRMITPEKLEECMRDAEIVVTHAGTGMLSRLHGLKKKHVVIPKQIRYGEANDGQVELAVKWCELGLGVLCMDLKNLEAKIVECRNSELKNVQLPSLSTFLRREWNLEVCSEKIVVA